MRRLLILAALLLLSPAVHAAQLEVTGAWAIATTPSGGPVPNIRDNPNDTMAYMTLANNSIVPVTITGFETPIAKMLMAHETVVTGGVARMNMLTPLTLTPNKHYVFAPRGAHLMLMGLSAPLAPGQKFPVIISYSDGTKQTVEITAQR